MAVTNTPPYPTGDSPNAPNYLETAKSVIIIDGTTGGPVTFGAGGDTEITVQASDPRLDIPAGNVSGQSSVNKFGENPQIAADTVEDVWDAGGTYSFPSTANITHIHQTVNQAAMLGATIEVQGLDANWDLVIQNAVLNGANTTTLVELTTPLIRVFRMKVLANVVANQIVEVTDSGDATTYAQIQAGNNQTLMAIYTVPNGKTAYMTNYYAHQTDETNKTPTSTEISLWAADRLNNYEFQLKHQLGIPEAGSGFQHVFNPYLKLNQRTDIKMTGLPANFPVKVHAGFDLILVDN